jgi:hypothetical protein
MDYKREESALKKIVRLETITIRVTIQAGKKYVVIVTTAYSYRLSYL